jgi:hypothetical protein
MRETHDEEIARLGMQYRVWRPRALDAWRRGGFTTGQTLLNVGCEPGYAYVMSRIEPSEGLFSATFNSSLRSVI